MSTSRPIPRFARRIITRFAGVVCPPELRASRRARPLLAEFSLYLAALPPHLRLGILAAFVLFDQRARFYPRRVGGASLTSTPRRPMPTFTTWHVAQALVTAPLPSY